MAGELPYINGKQKIIFFTDFDGTITLEDSNDHLLVPLISQHSEIDNLGFGIDKRRLLELEALKGNVTFRDAFKAMVDSVRTPFDKCLRNLQENIQFDPYFLDFYHWAKDHNVPIVVLSAGMTPVINALLERILGSKPDNIFIVANDIEPREGSHVNVEGGWQIKFRDDSQFGHDKSLEIKPYAALPSEHRPILLYAGDGVSDVSAASETDILFAKDKLDLVQYCTQKGIPFVPFHNWTSILATVRDIYEGGLKAVSSH